jgi:signal transduction protein with GAF and PtsI domain
MDLSTGRSFEMTERDCTFYQAFYDLAKTVNSSLEPGEVLAKIVEQVTKAMSAKGCTIRLLDKEGRRLLAGASYGLSKGYLRKGAVDVEKSGLDREALQGKNVYMADACSDDRFQYPDAAKAECIHSIMVVPLKVDDRVIGSLRLYSEILREFDKQEIEFLEAVSNISAIAIENARMHQALKKDYELLTAYEYRIFED